MKINFKQIRDQELNKRNLMIKQLKNFQETYKEEPEVFKNIMSFKEEPGTFLNYKNF